MIEAFAVSEMSVKERGSPVRPNFTWWAYDSKTTAKDVTTAAVKRDKRTRRMPYIASTGMADSAVPAMR
ncbi:hypothetical protein D3C71_1479630 [compost metagenome]